MNERKALHRLRHEIWRLQRDTDRDASLSVEIGSTESVAFLDGERTAYDCVLQLLEDEMSRA